MSVSQSNFLSQWRKIVIYCYIKKITYIVSKSRTLLYNSSVIPSTQRQKNECEFSPMWNFIWTNYGSLTLKNVKSCLVYDQRFYSENSVENTVKDINIGSSLPGHLDFRVAPIGGLGWSQQQWGCTRCQVPLHDNGNEKEIWRDDNATIHR